MTNHLPKIGNQIQRSSNHCKGEVIELDSINRRARIAWQQPTSPNAKPKPRTWVSFSDLVVLVCITSTLSVFDAYREKIASNYDEIGEYIAKK